MISKKYIERLKKFQFRWILNIYTLYLLAIIAIAICILEDLEITCLILIITLLVALILRITNIVLRRKIQKPDQKVTDWKVLRKQLTQILSESRILLDSAVELKSDETSTIIMSEEQVNGNFFEENEKLIETIRKINIDGLLCLLFLIQQQPAVASVRAIQKSLKIPLTSAYRHLQKLTELKLVVTYYTPERPSKTLYKITDEGSSLVVQLYEILGGSLIPVFETSNTETKAVT